MACARVSDGGVASCDDGSEHPSCDFKESENLDDDLLFLEDLDSYMDDINDRLTISRMVSDSVIKGMVNAVEQEAAEKITAKELEVARLKETLHFNQVGRDETEFSGSPVKQNQSRKAEFVLPCSFSNAFVDHGKMRESLGNLRSVAGQQIKKLKKEIYGINGCNSIRRTGSGSELLGLGGILQEKASDTWVCVDKTLDALKTTLDTICTQVDDRLNLAMTSVCEWQQEREFQGELEAMVIQSCIRSLEEEFEGKLWDQNARFCSSQRVNWQERINEISSLRKELDVISKSLSGPEMTELISLSSFDLDHFQRKTLSSHESKTGMPENLDSAQLKNMSVEELVNYVREMKRNHESTVHVITEELYNLKGKYLKDRGSSLHLRKDKEFDILRKKIPEIILKLDSFLVENEKLPPLSNDAGSLDSLMVRLENLLLENHQLRDSLTNKKKEVKFLSIQVSDAATKMLQPSLTETNLLKLIENLKSSVEDAHIEAFVSEEVNKCILREMMAQIKCGTEESELESIEDSHMKSLIMQGLCKVIFKETIKDAESQLNSLTTKYINRVSLEMKAVERVNLVKGELVEVLKQIEVYKDKINKLNQQLERTSKELREADEQRNMFQIVIQEKQNTLSLVQAKKEEERKQMEAVIVLVRELSKALADFDCKVAEGIKKNNLRLDSLNIQLNSLTQKANILRKTQLSYKQRFERRCSDLQKAEDEVDLLGDEVDTLSSLLEKIYIALDHYSPILQHYPGIVDILKLVRRELSGESTKSV